MAVQVATPAVMLQDQLGGPLASSTASGESGDASLCWMADMVTEIPVAVSGPSFVTVRR